MSDPSAELYDIIIDTIHAREDITYSEVIYVLERIKYQLMQDIDSTLKDEAENEEEENGQ